ncbi:hypothetical protein [Desulfolutivibrio sp.]|uniref:hypothetical protein n=1 Tax=Desulfolutivibrio sp. TaxID=2773296 RepID=UPI002F9687A9
MQTQLKQAVKRLFQAGGSVQKQVTITAKAGGTVNPSTGKMTGGTTTTVTIPAFLQGYKQKDIDGTLIKTTDRRLLMDKDDCTVAIVTNGKITIDGKTYNIVNIREVAGLCYCLQIRI